MQMPSWELSLMLLSTVVGMYSGHPGTGMTVGAVMAGAAAGRARQFRATEQHKTVRNTILHGMLRLSAAANQVSRWVTTATFTFDTIVMGQYSVLLTQDGDDSDTEDDDDVDCTHVTTVSDMTHQITNMFNVGDGDSDNDSDSSSDNGGEEEEGEEDEDSSCSDDE